MTTPDVNVSLIQESISENPAVLAVLKATSANTKSFSKNSVRTFYRAPDATGRPISHFEVMSVFRVLDKAGVGKFHKETDTFIWSIKSMQFAKLILGEEGGAILESNVAAVARRSKKERRPRAAKRLGGDPAVLLTELRELVNRQQAIVDQLGSILGSNK
jgi:hypothetical protein